MQAAATRPDAWHAALAEDVAVHFGADLHAGLSGTAAGRRRLQQGPNRLEDLRRAGMASVLARQFRDALVYVLLAAALISLAIGHRGDALTILAIVVLNALLGFSQEWKAERALEALGRMLAPRCRVRRGGEDAEIAAEDLVPGDLVLLSVGDRIPADLRLVRAWNPATDESALTGESGGVEKQVETVAAETPVAQRACMAWMGTLLVRGRAEGLVVATGMGTAFGRIAALTGGVDRSPTPLQRQLAVLGHRLAALGIAVALLVAATGWIAGRSLESMFLTGVSLAVAVVPEGLPAVVTLTLALGVRTMTARRALLRRLAAAETLGAATIICADKTGTLTRGEMTVQAIWTPDGSYTATGSGYDPTGHLEQDGRRIEPSAHADLLAFLESALRCNRAHLERSPEGWQMHGEGTEGALLTAACKAGLTPSDHAAETELPFDAQRKRMSVVAADGEGRIAHVKGAPETLLPLCTRVFEQGRERPLDDADRQAAAQAQVALASRGLRTLLLARRHLSADVRLEPAAVECELTLLGVAGLIDPPRPEVPAAVKLAREAGMRVLMITGDSADTALAVARQVGLPAGRAVTGAEVEALSDQALGAALEEDVIFARTVPEHKLRIVELLQGRGEVVAMTGDGVNDAPALKRADIGIAMGRRGTDVARGAADMVLLDDDFASIVGAVEEGRRQYDNIRKFVRYLLSSNTGEVLAIFAALLVGGPVLLLPAQILWMNLVTDGAAAVALGLEPAHRDTMRRPPRRRTEAMLGVGGQRQVLIYGAGIAALTLATYSLWSANPAQAATAQTAAFSVIIIAETINVLNFRVLGGPMASAGLYTNPWLLASVVAMLGLQVAAVYVPFLQQALHTVPLAPLDWLWLVLMALPILVLPQAFETWRARRVDA